MIRRWQRGGDLLWGHDGLDGLKSLWRLGLLAICGAAIFYLFSPPHRLRSTPPPTAARSFLVKGIVKELRPEESSLVVAHEAIPDYMEAMTMPFKVLRREDSTGLRAGDQISFRLSVTENESWIDRIVKTGAAPAAAPPAAEPAAPAAGQTRHPLLEYPFTNELGQVVRLGGFRGQALAITFFFTRCPIPEFCPRLSKNFAEACEKLGTLPGAPTNWHLLSVSFDPAFDTPAVLKAYAERYHYDPNHWSFITGPKDQIGEVARLSNVQVDPDGGLFNHNFRTMIIDASGRLQMVFPTGGDLSEAIVTEILKASAAGTNRPS